MGEHDLFQKIGFIGLGLIGGSIAKKIHTLYPDVTISQLPVISKPLPKLTENI